jgi:hypothetical protein
VNDFFSSLTRFVLRLLLVVAGLVFLCSVLVVASALALVWALRAAWARITGRPVSPWVMPMSQRTAATWASMRQRAGGFADTPASDAPPSKRSGVLPQVAADVTDVQAREVH